jgi:acyl carrier protein
MIDKDDFLDKFKSIFEEEDISKIDFSTEFKHLDEWDSLTALTLITIIDSNYKKVLTGENIESANTINDIYKIILS